MPHNIATINGQPAIMVVREKPWHKLGTVLSKPATAVTSSWFV